MLESTQNIYIVLDADSTKPKISHIEGVRIHCFKNGKTPQNDREVLQNADLVLDLEGLFAGTSPSGEGRYLGNIQRSWSGSKQFQSA